MVAELVHPTDPDALHFTCCRPDDNADVALCGTDVTDDAWAGEGDDPGRMCAACSHLEHTTYCPVDVHCDRGEDRC